MLYELIAMYEVIVIKVAKGDPLFIGNLYII